MQFEDLLKRTLDTTEYDCWERKRTANALTGVAVRLHSMGLSYRETAAILALLGENRSHQAIFQWAHCIAASETDPPTATPSRVAVDETAIQINGDWQWLYAAIDLDSLVILDAEIYSRHGTEPAAAFLHRLTEKHNVEDAVFLVDAYGYRTTFSRLGLSGRLDYSDRNHLEKWYHTLKMRTDRFHTSWVGGRPAVRQWIELFRRYYNQYRPNQALDGRTPEEVLIYLTSHVRGRCPRFLALARRYFGSGG